MKTNALLMIDEVENDSIVSCLNALLRDLTAESKTAKQRFIRNSSCDEGSHCRGVFLKKLKEPNTTHRDPMFPI